LSSGYSESIENLIAGAAKCNNKFAKTLSDDNLFQK